MPYIIYILYYMCVQCFFGSSDTNCCINSLKYAALKLSRALLAASSKSKLRGEDATSTREPAQNCPCFELSIVKAMRTQFVEASLDSCYFSEFLPWLFLHLLPAAKHEIDYCKSRNRPLLRQLATTLTRRTVANIHNIEWRMR